MEALHIPQVQSIPMSVLHIYTCHQYVGQPWKLSGVGPTLDPSLLGLANIDIHILIEYTIHDHSTSK